jgi:nucleotide-binding universal stress UspA family protein
MFKTLLIAIDGSDLGDKALAAGIELAKAQNGTIVVLTATDPVSTGIGSGGFGTIDAGTIIARLEESYTSQARTLLEGARSRVEAAGLTAETLHAPRQRPADAILSTARERGSDLIVMGSHGRRGLGRLLLGSQAAEVLSHASVPVLIVK